MHGVIKMGWRLGSQYQGLEVHDEDEGIQLKSNQFQGKVESIPSRAYTELVTDYGA